jgi:hypothetical protein
MEKFGLQGPTHPPHKKNLSKPNTTTIWFNDVAGITHYEFLTTKHEPSNLLSSLGKFMVASSLKNGKTSEEQVNFAS